MKMNQKQSCKPNRTLRLEFLEKREMLDAAGLASVAFDQSAALLGEGLAEAPAINLDGVNANHEDGVTIEQSATNVASFTMSWDAVEGAASYSVKVSKDGGNTWILARATIDFSGAVPKLRDTEAP